MGDHQIHEGHDHEHRSDCGHVAVSHEGHVDYIHDGHLHHPHGDHVDEHSIAIDDAHPAGCTPDHDCGGHEAGPTPRPRRGHQPGPPRDPAHYFVSRHPPHPPHRP